METVKNYENYPVWVVILSNLVSLSIYSLGLFILFRLGIIFSFLYLIYISIMEYRLMRYHCVDCYYWGKTCGFGKGRLSSLLFKKGDGTNFCKKEMSWKDMLPDLFITLIPLVTGIYLLITEFNFIILTALIILILLTTAGNGFIRGQLTCKYCKQKVLGCPAEKLFNKNK